MKKYLIKNHVLKAYIENDEAISASIQPDGNHLISLEDVDAIIHRVESNLKPLIMFKVKFQWSKDNIGRLVWSKEERIIEAIGSDDLHKKIEEYIRECHNRSVNRRYYMEYIDISKL